MTERRASFGHPLSRRDRRPHITPGPGAEEGTSDSGREAYTLRLDPRTDQTLVDTVSVDVDAQTGMPLGVEVLAVGQDEPAVSVTFTQFAPEVPDPDLFD